MNDVVSKINDWYVYAVVEILEISRISWHFTK